MPIYEFKCLKCNEHYELLVTNKDEQIELKCPKCNSEELERIISVTSYVMGGPAGNAEVKTETRTCASGSCVSYDIPGSTR